MGAGNRRVIAAIVAGAVALGAPAVATAQMGGKGMGGMKMPMGKHVMPRPENLDTATSKLTENRHYVATIAAEKKPVEINRMHRWVLTLRSNDGKPVEGAAILVDGGMPDHGHGLPTAPKVTKYLGDGRYLVEGVRFNMTGWWQLRFAIGEPTSDRVTFNLDLE